MTRKTSANNNELCGPEPGFLRVWPPLTSEGHPENKPWPKEKGAGRKWREHKEGAGKEQVCPDLRENGTEPPLSGTSGIVFVTISNLDAWGLWIREEKVGKDPPETVSALTSEYSEVLLCKLPSQALRDREFPLPVSWNTQSWNPPNCAVRKFKQPRGRSKWRGTKDPDEQPQLSSLSRGSTNLSARNKPF